MRSLVPQTALPGKSQSANDRLAAGLGYFSLMLGTTEVLAPEAVARAAGLNGQEMLVRAYGAREIAQGIAILATHDATPWIWGRVAGDAIDIATVLQGLRQGNQKNYKAGVALAALAVVTALDVICARGLATEKGRRTTAVADYSLRSGFPQGVRAARGAARDVKLPDDMRTPDVLQFGRQTGKAGFEPAAKRE